MDATDASTDCKVVQTQSWVVAHESPGIVHVAGVRFCLDAGKGTPPRYPAKTDPKNGQKVDIRRFCYGLS